MRCGVHQEEQHAGTSADDARGGRGGSRRQAEMINKIMFLKNETVSNAQNYCENNANMRTTVWLCDIVVYRQSSHRGVVDLCRPYRHVFTRDAFEFGFKEETFTWKLL